MTLLAVIVGVVVLAVMVLVLRKVEEVRVIVNGSARRAKLENEVLAAEVARLIRSELLADGRASASAKAGRAATELADARVATAEAAAAPSTHGPQEVVIVQPVDQPVPVQPVEPPPP